MMKIGLKATNLDVTETPMSIIIDLEDNDMGILITAQQDIIVIK